jgi:MSHA biogenesis protein MshO
MRRTGGFTLVELVLVMIVTSIIAASVAVFFKPAIDSYFDARRRAELTDTADTALRRVGREVRRAVPNSIRIPNDQCFEMVPTKAGGLYRRADDTVHADADPLDTTGPDASFDVLSLSGAGLVAGDSVVIGNQNTSDVYTGATRGTVNAWQSPPAPGGNAVGVGRIGLTAATQFTAGYDGGRFQIVDQNEPSVFYICRGTGEAGGNGTGELVRLVRAFHGTAPAACPAGGALLASRVASCSFVYDPNQGATQQSGFVWMHIELLSGGERVALAYGMHVSNVP